jgi:hypothetical protein
MINQTHTTQRAEPAEKGPSKELMRSIRKNRKKHKSTTDKQVKKTATKRRRRYMKKSTEGQE